MVAFGYRSELVETSVGEVHLLSREGEGDLPPVLLIHGFGAAAAQWALLMRALRAKTRGVLAIDLPGHGLSRRHADLSLDILRDGVIEALDRAYEIGRHKEPAIVVGNSLGGAVALRYVAARPERALAAYLMSPGGAPMLPEELGAVRELFRVVTHGDAKAFLDKLHADPLGLKGHLIAPAVRRTFRDESLHGLLARISDADWLTPGELASLQRPVRLLWGRKDKILPARSLSFWREHLPQGAEIDEPDRFGHVPHLDSARRTAADLLAFAERIRAEHP